MIERQKTTTETTAEVYATERCEVALVMHRKRTALQPDEARQLAQELIDAATEAEEPPYEDAELCGHWTSLMAEDDVPGEDSPREARLHQSEADYAATHPWAEGAESAVCLDTPITKTEGA